MRFSRSFLLGQLTGNQAPTVALLEAPSGYGKSWLLRQAWGSGALRLRGELGPLGDEGFCHDGRVVIDDAHRLSDDDMERLVEYVEFADDDLRLFIAGRLLPDALHDVVRLVDGIVLDASAMALTADELTSEVTDLTPSTAEQLIEVTDGCIRSIASALEQTARQSGANPVALASRIVRSSASATLQHLDESDHAIVAVLARSPGIDRHLIENVAGPGTVTRLIAANISLRRHAMGGFEVATPTAFRGTPIDSTLALRLSKALIGRQRPVDAIELLLDAGEPEDAAQVMSGLTESVVDSLEPRSLLSMLARLGAIVNRDPALLLIRATAARAVGRVDDSFVDIQRASSLATDAMPTLKRRIDVESASVQLDSGHISEARRAAEQALSDIETGEERTFARVHQILAECDIASNKSSDLQQAVESYRIAAAAWDACDEHSRARVCRRDMTTGALVPLGRYDEALKQLEHLLTEVDVSDTERASIIYTEAMVLVNAGHLQSAETRFKQVSDLGTLQDNQRLVAAAAWGRAMIATRRGSLDDARKWIVTAENTALTQGDDVLGVPFLCDVVEMYGALGNIEEAAVYLERVKRAAALYPDDVRRTEFILDARRGNVGDIEEQLGRTMPHERWRVLLVSAHAKARVGELDQAQRLLAVAERELAALGFDGPAVVGEQREYEGVLGILAQAAGTSTGPVRDSADAELHEAKARNNVQLKVFAHPTTLQTSDSVIPIPPGNPLKLVSVVVAYGGSVTFDQLGEALWPGESTNITRTRLRNVLLRLRRATGEVITRTGSGIRLLPDIWCDLFEFDRVASDALSTARTDPDLAGRLARDAVTMTDGDFFDDFEYEDWAAAARRGVHLKLISLLDLLSIQAEDVGDLPLAQSYAERALNLDRYQDSRYIRIAELLTLQDRTAAAIAVLDDAAAAARELDDSDSLSSEVARQREDLVRRAVSDR